MMERHKLTMADKEKSSCNDFVYAPASARKIASISMANRMPGNTKSRKALGLHR
jgi:hypothetical protein